MRAGGFIYSRSKNYTWEKNTTRWSAHPEIESLLSPYKVPRTGQHPTISLVRNEVDKARHTQLFITENSPIPFSPKLPCHQNGERGRTSVSCPPTWTLPRPRTLYEKVRRGFEVSPAKRAEILVGHPEAEQPGNCEDPPLQQ
jgi:hypothetical protein